jgi:hypothetical protein
MKDLAGTDRHVLRAIFPSQRKEQVGTMQPIIVALEVILTPLKVSVRLTFF